MLHGWTLRAPRWPARLSIGASASSTILYLWSPHWAFLFSPHLSPHPFILLFARFHLAGSCDVPAAASLTDRLASPLAKIDYWILALSVQANTGAEQGENTGPDTKFQNGRSDKCRNEIEGRGVRNSWKSNQPGLKECFCFTAPTAVHHPGEVACTHWLKRFAGRSFSPGCWEKSARPVQNAALICKLAPFHW